MTANITHESDLRSLSESEQRLVEFAQKLIATPSPTGDESAVGALIAVELEQLGYHDVTIDTHGNVHGTIGSGPPRLMFNGHMDHVPPAGMEDPYGGQLVDATEYGEHGLAIRGRGACDMKCNVASGAYAAAFLDQSQLRHGSYIFTADVEEETDSPHGIPSLLDAGLWADYGISGESTELQVYLGHRGKLQFDLIVPGQSSHASTPADGLNAVYQAIPFLRALAEYPERLPGDPLYGDATVTVTDIRSEPGLGFAVVPSSCTIRIDRRYVPSETPDSVQRDMEALVKEVASREHTDARLELINVYPLMAIDQDHELVKHTVSAVTKVTGTKPDIRTWQFGVNGTFMSDAGIPTVGMGPGSEDWAHTSREHILIDDLLVASRVYGNLITQLCT